MSSSKVETQNPLHAPLCLANIKHRDVINQIRSIRIPVEAQDGKQTKTEVFETVPKKTHHKCKQNFSTQRINILKQNSGTVTYWFKRLDFPELFSKC